MLVTLYLLINPPHRGVFCIKLILFDFMSLNIMKKGIYMKNTNPKINALCICDANPTSAIENINTYIENNSCEYLDIDISLMNIIDSCYVTTLCSTKHYIKYPNGIAAIMDCDLY